MTSVLCRRAGAAFAAVVVSCAVPAQAQFGPAEQTVGERYRVEASIAWWDADPTLVVRSESLGIAGDDIDLVNDLGITKKRLPEYRLVLRPARKHKFRLHALPVRYEAEAVLQREFVFNGLRYRVGLPVTTTAELKAYRFGYEYDFVSMDRGYVGALIDVKYTDTRVDLSSAIGAEFASAVAVIPTVGGIGRGYLTRNISLTGEVTFFKVPENLSATYKGRYLDYDLYLTVNFTSHAGVQVGRRSVDVFYHVDDDRGDLTFTGWYVSGVIRF